MSEEEWLPEEENVPTTFGLEQRVLPAINIREVSVECTPSTDALDAWAFRIGFCQYLRAFHKPKKVIAAFSICPSEFLGLPF